MNRGMKGGVTDGVGVSGSRFSRGCVDVIASSCSALVTRETSIGVFPSLIMLPLAVDRTAPPIL